MTELPNETIDKIFNAGYKKGRADAIDEIYGTLFDELVILGVTMYQSKLFHGALEKTYQMLKEQKNE